MNPLFLKVHREKIAPWEGGYSDHPEDAGGATNYGVSMYFLTDFAKRHGAFLESIGVILPVTKDTIKNLTVAQSEEIFYKAFWQAMDCDELPPHVAFMLYDCSGNHGMGGATKIAQRAYNAITPSKPLVVDGAYGKLTKAALSKPSGEVFIDAWADVREKYYNDIVARKPSQKVFLKGWLRRAREMREYAKTLL